MYTYTVFTPQKMQRKQSVSEWVSQAAKLLIDGGAGRTFSNTGLWKLSGNDHSRGNGMFWQELFCYLWITFKIQTVESVMVSLDSRHCYPLPHQHLTLSWDENLVYWAKLGLRTLGLEPSQMTPSSSVVSGTWQAIGNEQASLLSYRSGYKNQNTEWLVGDTFKKCPVASEKT